MKNKIRTLGMAMLLPAVAFAESSSVPEISFLEKDSTPYVKEFSSNSGEHRIRYDLSYSQTRENFPVSLTITDKEGNFVGGFDRDNDGKIDDITYIATELPEHSCKDITGLEEGASVNRYSNSLVEYADLERFQELYESVLTEMEANN